MSDGVLERQAPGGVGGGLPAEAHRGFAGRGVTGGCRRREVGGQFGRVDHSAVGSGCFQRGGQVAVHGAAGGHGELSRQNLAEQVVGEARPGSVPFGDRYPGRGRLLDQGGQVGVVAENPGQQPGAQRRPVKRGHGEHTDARLGQAGEAPVDHLTHRVQVRGAVPRAGAGPPGLEQAGQLAHE